MLLKEKINSDLKEALKNKEKIRLETVRSIRALILEFEKSGTDKEFNKEEEIKLLSSAAKKRKESIEQFENAGRTELAEKEKAELIIIQGYLPKQLSDEEIFAEVSKIAAEVDAKTQADFPKLMPAVIKSLKGQADGKTIKANVEKYLSGN